MHPNKRDKGQVEVLSGMGATPQFIAAHLNLTLEELKQHYQKQLETGEEEANLQVARTFHEMATSGEHPTMTLAWMKMRAKWSEAPSTAQTDDLEVELETAREKLLTLLNRANRTG